MIVISHRGNTAGPLPEWENNPNYVDIAWQEFNVEIDVRFLNGEFWLGHDKPQYKVNYDFVQREGMWCHAKDVNALDRLLSMNVNCFWHQIDDRTLTSKGVIWTYPGRETTKKSVIVQVDCDSFDKLVNTNIVGVCTDYAKFLK
jgi:hypothetical protein